MDRRDTDGSTLRLETRLQGNDNLTKVQEGQTYTIDNVKSVGLTLTGCSWQEERMKRYSEKEFLTWAGKHAISIDSRYPQLAILKFEPEPERNIGVSP
jgi:hypothetical protein